MTTNDSAPGATRISTLRATAHPLRLRMLSLLTGADMSAAEVARELETTQANASYHLRVLADAGLLVEAGEEKVRGGVAKKYRHHWDLPGLDTPDGTADPALSLRVISEDLVRRYAMRRRNRKQIISDAEMWVTPETWAQVVDLVKQASSLIHSEAKRPRTEGTVHVNLTAAAFEMTDPPRQAAATRRKAARR
ncbi:MAG TPA: helix-turn-helix domain-containing protein [Nocardioidaceae bacterium]|nr:helix-turn-helix domain-containing protein [Nocardioidaceae bacterium]